MTISGLPESAEVATGELCPTCGGEFTLEDSDESIRVFCGCGEVSVLA